MNNENVSFLNLNSNEKNKKQSPNRWKRKREVKKSMILRMKNDEIISNDRKAENIVNNIISKNNNIPLNELINIPISAQYPFDGFLFSYIIQKQTKTEKDLYFLIHFLKFYDTFNALLKKMYNIDEKIFLFNQIINKIIIEEKSQNDILFKLGELSEKFYL